MRCSHRTTAAHLRIQEICADGRDRKYLYRNHLLHSRLIIFIVTFFLEDFFGGLLYAQNAAAVGKKHLIGTVILLSLLYNFVMLRLFTTMGINNTAARLFVVNMIAACILAGWVGNIHFKNLTDYDRRSPLWPLLSALGIYGVFIILNMVFPGRMGR